MPETVDAAAALAIEGVIRTVRLPYAVGVLAETPWAAFKAKNALKVTWSRNAKAWGYSDAAAYQPFAAAARDLTRTGLAWEHVASGLMHRRDDANGFTWQIELGNLLANFVGPPIFALAVFDAEHLAGLRQ